MSNNTVDFHYVEQKHDAIHARLLNWARWVSDKPVSITQPMWRNSLTSKQWEVSPQIKIDVDTLDGHEIEKAVYKLPEPMRGAIRWYYVTRCGVTVQRKSQGLTAEGLAKAVHDGRTMLCSRL